MEVDKLSDITTPNPRRPQVFDEKEDLDMQVPYIYLPMAPLLQHTPSLSEIIQWHFQPRRRNFHLVQGTLQLSRPC